MSEPTPERWDEMIARQDGIEQPAPLPCMFCQIARGEAPATIIAEGPRWVAFEPLGPHAPGHVPSSPWSRRP